MITHDLGVVASMCERIAVMYAGHIVEYGTADEIFYEPKHEYTKGLINSIPKLSAQEIERLVPIEGSAGRSAESSRRLPVRAALRKLHEDMPARDAAQRRSLAIRTTATAGCFRKKNLRKGRQAVSENEKLVEVQHLQQYFPGRRQRKAQKIRPGSR